ncbi:MAG: type II toxin-antitoxin system RelB/DinJ family antitoxin [Treponema sp.]|nr:type II toxin-antitoxin system RelB/DinJ family antitoxin [Treponema sp.]
MVNTKSNVNVRIDTDIKELATMLLGRMGLDQTTAIDMFFRQIIAERRLPFQPVITPPLDEQIITAAIKRNPDTIELGADKDGSILIDKKLHPEIYDWVVNG